MWNAIRNALDFPNLMISKKKQDIQWETHMDFIYWKLIGSWKVGGVKK